MQSRIENLYKQANEIRKLTIEEIGKLGVGHIGGCLSICEVLAALYFDIMKVDPENPKWPERDRFVLSKGHGGPALYATLALKGYIPVALLDTLNRPNTTLPSHCDMQKTPGIDMTTGSLGQGFSAAVGMAVGAKMDKLPSTIYTVIGDGESDEGQIWESALFAAGRGLDNLIAFTDYNKLQLDGFTQDISPLEPLDDKWRAFGWHVQSINGHSIEEILYTVRLAQSIKGKPSMILLNTVKGKGAAFCENLVASHNMKFGEETWKPAVAALEKEGV